MGQGGGLATCCCRSMDKSKVRTMLITTMYAACKKVRQVCGWKVEKKEGGYNSSFEQLWEFKVTLSL